MSSRATMLSANGRWPADVAVWKLRMPMEEAGSAFLYLNEEETSRAARYFRREDRVRFAFTRSVLRELLGGYLDLRPDKIQFFQEERGRPGLVGPRALSFNVSHSKDYALIAVSPLRVVGVDVEYIDGDLDWRALLPQVCTDSEARMLVGAAASAQRQDFFRCWTAKEAVLKAVGLGITEGLRALTIDPRPDGIPRPLVGPDTRFAHAAAYEYRWLTDIAGYMSCVAYGPVRR